MMGVGVWWILRAASAYETRKLSRQSETASLSAELKGQRPFVHGVIGLTRGWPLRLVGGVAFLGTLAAAKSGHWLGSDYAVGGAFAIWMLSLTGSWRREGWPRRIATGLSEISYTLYVTHFPVLFLVAAAVLKGRQFQPDAQGYAWFAALAAGILLFATAMWWLFERNTDRVRKMVWKAR